MNEAQRPPLPPFTFESAVEKVRLAEDGWNSRDPTRVALAYTVDSQWRNRAEFVTGREAIVAFLSTKWRRELDYRLIKELWAFGGNRIAVRFAYESHDDSGNWFRSFGNGGSSTRAALCESAMPASTTCLSALTTAASGGRLAAGQMIIPDSVNSVFSRE